MYKQFIVEAETLKDNPPQKIKGGICQFIHTKTKERVVFMLHEDNIGRPVVTQINPYTIKGIFDSWAWIKSWAEAYKETTGKESALEFLEWIQHQPAVPA